MVGIEYLKSEVGTSLFPYYFIVVLRFIFKNTVLVALFISVSADR